MYKINTSKLSQQYYRNITKSSLEITITLSKHHLFNYHKSTSHTTIWIITSKQKHHNTIYHLKHYQTDQDSLLLKTLSNNISIQISLPLRLYQDSLSSGTIPAYKIHYYLAFWASYIQSLETSNK